MPEGLARYGLKENPFTPRVLNPLLRPADRDLFVQIDGLSSLPRVDATLRTAVEQKLASFFLVTGRNGCGRTSVANYILDRHRELRKIEPKRFLDPQREANNHDDLAIFISWLGYLVTDVYDINVELPDALSKEIDRVERLNPNMMKPRLRGIITRISSLLVNADPAAGFAVCLEDIRTYQLVATASKIFERSQTVCVFTAQEYDNIMRDVIEPFEANFPNADDAVVKLYPLSGRDASVLVEKRWQQISGHENPFDPTGIKQAFGTELRPVGRVLSVVGRLLDLKISDNKSGDPWPQARELYLTREYICDKVPILEGRI